MKIKKSRGGVREGAGRKTVEEKRIQVPLSIHPSALEPFRSKTNKL